MTGARYSFEFISHYDGKSNFRIYRNGNDNGRFSVNRNRECSYIDGSGLIRAEIEAFNAYKLAEWQKAAAEFGPDAIGPWLPYVAKVTE